MKCSIPGDEKLSVQAGSRATVMYRFAAADDGRPVDVLSLHGDRREFGHFKCLACGSRVVPHLGRVKAHHFQHFEAQVACSGLETYLHRAAKAVFLDEFASRRSRGEPFWLRFKVRGTCNHYEPKLHFTCAREHVQQQDLLSYFDQAALETAHSGFVADVLLSGRSRKATLLLEFAVRHPCDPAKIASGLRIVEVLIKTDQDVARLRSGIIDGAEDPQVRCYNLRPRPPYGSLCAGDCPTRLGKFVVYKSGKAHLGLLSAREAVEYRMRASASYSKLLVGVDDPAQDCVRISTVSGAGADDGASNDPAALFARESINAHFSRSGIKSCYVCRHHGINGVTTAVWCRAKRCDASANDAADCSLYKPCATRAELQSIQRRNSEWWKKHGIAFTFRKLF